ncbi:MAG: SAM-dependent methyltransferase [Desulfurococcales archaeon]|nr:SAM-dependent methyltransferase [Desulfurococcales archaeon]
MASDSPCTEKSWLALAGAGIGPESMTVGLIELARCADRVVVETYTLPGSDWVLEALAPLAGNRIERADRSVLEEGAARLVRDAMGRRVLVVAPGDPLIATTHRSILVTASRLGVRTIVLPGVSGVCVAKAYAGLDYYKYGRTLTLPGPWRMVKPYSVLLGLAQNLCFGMHTLLLLDIDPATGRQLEPCEGLRLLAGLEAEAGVSLLRDLEVLIVERAGLPGSRVSLARGLDGACGLPPVRAPASVVVPGRLAPYEAEALEALAGVSARGNQGLSSVACQIVEALSE